MGLVLDDAVCGVWRIPHNGGGWYDHAPGVVGDSQGTVALFGSRVTSADIPDINCLNKRGREPWASHVFNETTSVR